MLARRIIPCLDVAGGRVVKGVHFESLRDAGDPVEQAARYDAEGADELVFLDISASPDERGAPRSRWWRGSPSRSSSRSRWVAASAPWPMPAPRSAPGADKVSVNTAAVRDPVAGLPARGELREPVRRGGGGCAAGRTAGSP